MDEEDAPSANAVRPWPSARLHAIDRERDAELADVLNRTEIMVASFHKQGHLTLKLGQLFLDTVRHCNLVRCQGAAKRNHVRFRGQGRDSIRRFRMSSRLRTDSESSPSLKLVSSPRCDLIRIFHADR